MIIFATFSFFGILGSVSEGSWVWSLLFFLNLVGALVAMTDTPPRGYSYFRRMSAVVLAMTVFVLAP